MFCYQCEQTMRTESGAGCTVKGVCGKDEATADLQDVLVYQTKGIGQYRIRLEELGIADEEADRFVLNALFSTLTNVVKRFGIAPITTAEADIRAALSPKAA